LGLASPAGRSDGGSASATAAARANSRIAGEGAQLVQKTVDGMNRIKNQ
jgi:hypothetical protein